MNDLLRRAGEDPWSLDLQERQQLSSAMQEAQRHWLPILKNLVEPPVPDDSFPAFLLETQALEPLREQILAQNGTPGAKITLDTATADTLQRFADHYRAYLNDLHARTRVRA